MLLLNSTVTEGLQLHKEIYKKLELCILQILHSHELALPKLFTVRSIASLVHYCKKLYFVLTSFHQCVCDEMNFSHTLQWWPGGQCLSISQSNLLPLVSKRKIKLNHSTFTKPLKVIIHDLCETGIFHFLQSMTTSPKIFIPSLW